MSNLDLFVRITVALIAIIFFAQIVGRLAKLIGQPRVVGEMISGVLLGPTLFGTLFPDISAYMFSDETMPFLFVISNLGLSFYMFLIGSELNLKLFNKNTLKDSAALSVAAVIIPFLLGGVAMWMFGDELNKMEIDSVSFAVFLGSAFAITAFPMLARILQEKNIVNTRLGAISILSASIQDVISWIMLGIVTIMCTTQQYSKILIMIIGAAALTIILFKVVNPILKKIADKVHITEDLTPGRFGLVIILLLLSVLTTDYLGLYSVFGGFIFGLSLPRKNNFIPSISIRLKDVTVMVLLPVFFAFSGLNANLIDLLQINLIVPSIVIVLLAFAGKYLSSLFTLRFFSNLSWRESSAIGGLINSRGLMALIIANIGLSYELIDEHVYSILALIAVTTTLAALPIYNWSLGEKNKK